MRDVQQLTDDLADALERAVSVEDRRWRLLAYSAQDQDVDDVRRSSILLRQAAPDVVSFLDSLGLHRGRRPVAVPANDALGMLARTCVPLRHGDRLLGYLWVLAPPSSLSSAQLDRLVQDCVTVADALWDRTRAEDEQGALRQAQVDALLSDRDADATAGVLSADLGWPREGRFVAALGVGPPELAERVRRGWRHGEVLAATWEGHPLAVAQLPRALAPTTLAKALRKAGAEVAAAGLAVGHLTHLRRSVESARSAMLAARADSGLGPATSWDAVGAWGPIVELWLLAGRPEPPAQIAALAARRDSSDLFAALEAALDSSGDLAAAAAALHMHRATLYRRLRRVQDVSGLDFRDGDDRLLAHLGVRLRRLSHLER